MKSKEEGQILGLPKDDDKKSDKESETEDEPSIYFYEDDDEELENLSKKWNPILTALVSQIRDFEKYNGSKEFQRDNNYSHTIIMDAKNNQSRSSIGVKKSSK